MYEMIKEFILLQEYNYKSWLDKSIPEVIDHIVDYHHAILRERIEQVRKQMDICASKDHEHKESVGAVQRFFEDLVRDVMIHVEKEENDLFPVLKKSEVISSNISRIVKELNEEHNEVGEALHLEQLDMVDFLLPDEDEEDFNKLADLLKVFKKEFYEHIQIEEGVLFKKIRELNENSDT